MTEKKKLYISIAVFISLLLVFGSIHDNFSAKTDDLSSNSHNALNNSYNNTTQENITLQSGNNSNASTDQITAQTNKTMMNSTTAKNQSTPQDDINTILNPFKADIIPTNKTSSEEPQAAAGGTVGTMDQTGPLPTINSHLTLKQCLKPTIHAQSNSATIKALAKKITKGATSKYAKAVKIFDWVRDHIAYSFYYNTKYGAVKTLKKMKGNCVDTSHLLVALSRAAGIPTRYVHVKAKFPDGTYYGHVFAQVYVGGKWYNVDASSSKNGFGDIEKWDQGTAKIKGVYASLPF